MTTREEALPYGFEIYLFYQNGKRKRRRRRRRGV